MDRTTRVLRSSVRLRCTPSISCHGDQGMTNLLSSSKKRRPSITSWLGKACSRFMKLLTRMKNMMKMSRWTKDVRKKWYARNKNACARYLLLMDRMTRAALMALAVLDGLLNLMTLDKPAITRRWSKVYTCVGGVGGGRSEVQCPLSITSVLLGFARRELYQSSALNAANCTTPTT
jgi:hypothetical protein